MIYELAGVIGTAPDPFTLRELRWMAEGRWKSIWQPASLMMSLFANAHRKPGSAPFSAATFNPFSQAAGVDNDKMPATISALKCFVKDKPKPRIEQISRDP